MFKYGTIPFGNTEEVAMKMKEVGEFIAAERKRQGVTQLQLSQAADVGRRFVVEVESGKATVQADGALLFYTLVWYNWY